MLIFNSMSIQTLEIIHLSALIMAFPISILMSWWYGKRYGYSAKKAISYGMVMALLIVIFTYACQWVPGWFGFTVNINAARTFIFVPLFTLMLSRFWKIPMMHGADFATPTMFFARTVMLIGCTLLGCGQAVPCSWGIYSPAQGCVVFPIDLIDLLGTLTAGVVSIIYAKKLNYNGNGRIFAVAMYILGFVRLFIQLGSSDYWWFRGFNDESVYSVISIGMAIVILYRTRQKNNSTNTRKLEN